VIPCGYSGLTPLPSMKHVNRRIIAMAVVAACSSKNGEASPLPQHLQTAGATHFAFVPDAIANQLGGATSVFAARLAGSDLTKLTAWLPPELACVADVARSIDVVVGADLPPSFAVFTTGLREDAVAQCLRKLGPALGDNLSFVCADDKSNCQIRTSDGGFSMVWSDGIATIRETSASPLVKRPPNKTLTALSKQVPANAKAFFVSGGSPARKIKTAIVTLIIRNDHVGLKARAEATEPGVVAPWLHGFVEGVKDSLTSKHIKFDDSWFAESLAEPFGMVEAHIPLAVLNLVGSPVRDVRERRLRTLDAQTRTSAWRPHGVVNAP